MSNKYQKLTSCFFNLSLCSDVTCDDIRLKVQVDRLGFDSLAELDQKSLKVDIYIFPA